MAVAVVQARDRGRPIRRFLGEYRYAIGAWAWSRALTLLAVAMVGWVTRPHRGLGLVHVISEPLRRWDGFWYLQIAQYNYDPTLAHGNAPAFYPLYPAVVAVTRAVTRLSYPASGVLISSLLLLPALLLLYRITFDRFGEEIARRTVLLLSLSPMSFVFSAVYTESLALLLVLAAFAWLERGRVFGACGIGMLAVLARPVGILLAPAIAWRVFDDGGRRVTPRLFLRLTPILLLPLALVGFQAYLWWRTGTVFASHAAEARGWGRSAEPLYILLLPVAILHAVWIAVVHPDLGLAISAAAAFALTWLLAAGAWLRKIPIEYVIFGAGCVILPAYTGTWLGMPRFGLMVFPAFWVLAILAGKRDWIDTALRTGMPASMVGLVFVSYGVGTFTP